MSCGEWCPVCGSPIIAVTRGIPSVGRCKNGHSTDRRDVLRREPTEETKGAIISRLTAELTAALARVAELEAVTLEVIEWHHRQMGTYPEWFDRARKAVGQFDGDAG